MKKERITIRILGNFLIEVTAESFNDNLYFVNFNTKENKYIKEFYQFIKSNPYWLVDKKSRLMVCVAKSREAVSDAFQECKDKYYQHIKSRYYKDQIEKYIELVKYSQFKKSMTTYSEDDPIEFKNTDPEEE